MLLFAVFTVVPLSWRPKYMFTLELYSLKTLSEHNRGGVQFEVQSEQLFFCQFVAVHCASLNPRGLMGPLEISMKLY